MMVNAHGRRFGDESFFHTYSSSIYEFDGHRQVFPNWPAWFVFDQNYRDKYPIGPIAPGEALPQGMAMMADSVEALATVAGIDAAGLAATIERFTGHAEGGNRSDVRRGGNEGGSTGQSRW